jgi:hypothetical protein
MKQTKAPRPDPSKVLACIRAVRLMGHGMVHESYELMKNCRGVDLREAARILEEERLVLSKISEIGKRHPAMKGTVRQVVERAGRRRRGKP